LVLRESKCQEAGEDCIMKSFITFTLRHILLGRFKADGMGEACSNMREMRNSENLKRRDHFGRYRCRWEDNIKCISKGKVVPVL